MSLQFYDPEPARHDFLSRMYFAPMLAYAQEHGIACSRIGELTPSRGNAVICDADYLTPEKVRHFKENDCEIFGFASVDSAYLPEVLRYAPELLLVNRVFMLSGVPNRNFSHATAIDSEFNITAERRKYLPDDAWERFDFMRERGAIQSLPYPIWNRVMIPERKTFGARRPTVLFRGGAHFLRVVTFLMALRNKCADSASGFLLRDYFKEEMNPQFRYCDECRDIFRRHGRFPVGQGTGDQCTSIARWGDELDLSSPGVWNNKCPRSFYWLAEQFAKRHGPIDMGILEQAMNFVSEPEERHRASIGECCFFADCKWEFSIYAAQRFWEAASVGTINLLPLRAADQDYFPAMKPGEHYVTFGDDLSMPEGNIQQEVFEKISQNAYDLWHKWIRPDAYAISTNLLGHIFDTILTPRNT